MLSKWRRLIEQPMHKLGQMIPSYSRLFTVTATRVGRIALFGLCFVAIGGEAKAQAMTSGSLTDAGNIELGGQAMRLLEQQVRDKRSEEHTSELQSIMRISYAVFCL